LRGNSPYTFGDRKRKGDGQLPCGIRYSQGKNLEKQGEGPQGRVGGGALRNTKKLRNSYKTTSRRKKRKSKKKAPSWGQGGRSYNPDAAPPGKKPGGKRTDQERVVTYRRETKGMKLTPGPKTLPKKTGGGEKNGGKEKFADGASAPVSGAAGERNPRLCDVRYRERSLRKKKTNNG